MRTDMIEGRIEHPDDLGALIADDGFFLLVPENRHRHAAAIGRMRAGVDLMHEAGLIEGIATGSTILFEGPAVFSHVPVNHRDIDHRRQAFEFAQNQGAMGPGAGERDIEVIASDRRLEAAVA